MSHERSDQKPQIIVQIPCFNEEQTIEATVAGIRQATASIPNVRIIIVDDGSTDGTITAARRAGIDCIVRLPRNLGLAQAFLTGIEASLKLGADIIVNTDADNQYKAAGIPVLIEPIVETRADMVIGARPIDQIEHFSFVKKLLQRLGSRAIKTLSGADVDDATSGFRAISRNAALRLNVFNRFTYTLETIIQAGRSGLKIVSVPIEVNPPTRPSRLFRTTFEYVRRSAVTILRVYTLYEPLRTYLLLGLAPFLVSVALAARYVLLISFFDPTRSHAPSLILAAALFVLAVILWAIGVLADLIASNRRLLEGVRLEQRRNRLRKEEPFDRDDNFELLVPGRASDDP